MRKRPSLTLSTHQCVHSWFHPFSYLPIHFLSKNSSIHLLSFRNFTSILSTIPIFTLSLIY